MSSAHGLFDLSGQIAVITGGSRGIGLGIARAFCEQGAQVFLSARDEQRLRDAAEQLRADGFTANAFAADVSTEDSVQRFADFVYDVAGRCDILVNNAAINPHYAYLENTSTDEWNRIFAVNVDGAFFSCREFGRRMLASNGGSIINVSSIAGTTALRKQAPYCASKGALEQMTRALAIDWADRGVRVNAIACAYIETDLTREVREHAHLSKRILERTPMGRFGRVEECAGAAVFLASRAASYVTGHTLAVDGGWLAA